MERLTLHEIGKAFGTDKAEKHKFCNFYDSFLSAIREDPVNVLEIGIFKGNSLRMWREYFQNGLVFGADNDKNRLLFEDRIFSQECDQNNKLQLASLFPGITFSVIVDDGGHKMDQQQITLSILFDRLTSGGFYILEDLHTSNMEVHRYFKEFSTSTLFGLSEFKTSNSVNFYYLTDLENLRLTESIRDVHIFKNGSSITSVIIKK